MDLMVRMLGFSDEDKQRIGVAQQGAGKGVVRGVIGLPGRLVGGILGGSSSAPAANAGSDNQVISSRLVFTSPLALVPVTVQKSLKRVNCSNHV